MGDPFLAKKALLYNVDARFQKLDLQSVARAFSKFCVYKAPILQQSPKALIQKEFFCKLLPQSERKKEKVSTGELAQ